MDTSQFRPSPNVEDRRRRLNPAQDVIAQLYDQMLPPLLPPLPMSPWNELSTAAGLDDLRYMEDLQRLRQQQEAPVTNPWEI